MKQPISLLSLCCRKPELVRPCGGRATRRYRY